jgi:hypothetical protein
MIPIDTITAAIAAISAGVTIRDTNALADAVTLRDCPVLVPRPNGFVNLSPVQRDTYGPSATARKTVTFSLNYRFFHTPIGIGRGMYDVFPDFLDKCFAIFDALIATDLGGTIDMDLNGIPELGVVVDYTWTAMICRDISETRGRVDSHSTLSPTRLSPTLLKIQ